jgi:cytochrome P450
MMSSVSDPRSLKAVEDLPVFDRIDQSSFGTDVASMCAELFADPYQGPMRTTAGGYTDGSVFIYRNAELKTLVSHQALTNQPVKILAAPYRDQRQPDPSGFEQLMGRNLFTMQAPEHGTARQLVSRRMTTGSISRLAQPVTEMVLGLVDRASEEGEVDFRKAVADEAMAGFWQIALGWTPEEAAHACSLAAKSQMSNLLNPSSSERRAIDRASAELLRFLTATIRRQIDAGTQSLLAELVTDYASLPLDAPGRPVVLEEVFGASLLDGLHSLGGVIANVTYGLLCAPEALAAVRQDRDLVRAAYHEGVRLHPAVILTQRHASEDLVIDDLLVPGGTPVTMGWLLGNRDPEAFDDPDCFRLGRPVGPQATFGGGFHICPGRNIVKFLCETVIRAITDSSVQIELAGECRWLPATGLHELKSMPILIKRR